MPHASVAKTVTKTIGTAVGRDYSTISAWESELTDTDIYASGDKAAGDCYADSDFTENVFISGAFDLSGLTLTAAFPDRHDGTVGSGVVIKPASTSAYAIKVIYSGVDPVNHLVNPTVSFLELNGNASGYLGFFGYTRVVFSNNLVHNFGSTSGVSQDVYIMTNPGEMTFQNNFVFNNTCGATADLRIHWASGSHFGTFIYNNTYYYNNVGDSSTNDGWIFHGSADHEDSCIENVIILRYDDNYWDSKDSSATLDYWGAVGAITGVSNVTTDTYSNAFLDTSTSDPDLHLKTGTNFIDAAVDLGTSPPGPVGNGLRNVEVDIDGNNRDSSGVTWDLGAHEFGLPVPSTGKKMKPDTRFNLFHGVEGFGAFSTHYNF